VNTSNVALKATAMPEWRRIFEAEDSDFGGGAWVPWEWVLPLKWVPQGAEVPSDRSSSLGWRRLAFGNGRPLTQNRPKQTTISPGKRPSVY
jgi:hypothetical protein